MEERQRAYLYRIGLAVVGLLIVYGVLTEDVALHWSVLLAAVLGEAGLGLATKNTSTRQVEAVEYLPAIPVAVAQEDYIERAVSYLKQSGYSPHIAERTVRDYLAGKELTVDEANSIRTLEAVGIRPLKAS